jgi:hypothetical protein
MKKPNKMRPQDRPQTKLRIANRREKLVKIFAEGATITKAHEQLKAEGIEVSRATVGFDLQALSRTAPERLQDEREKAGVYLDRLRHDIESAKKLPLKDRVSLALSIYDRFERLLGLAAPTKSISAKINADVDPAQLVGYRKFVTETAGLTLEQIESVYKFARSLARPKSITVGPPATSELWDEEPKELSE